MAASLVWKSKLHLPYKPKTDDGWLNYVTGSEVGSWPG
jgi:hypothetical protein